MIPTWDRTRLIELTGLLCDERITDAEFAELSQLLEDHDDARRVYQLCIATHLRIEQAGAEMLGVPTLARSASEGVSPSPTQSVSEAILSSTHIPHSTFRISAIAAVVAFIAIGILAYSFWPGPAVLPVVHQTPAAKIAHLTNAKWKAAFSPPSDNVLTTGQRLKLESGSAEITFNGQARVILEGPAELTIVDAAACRLADGKLVAQVPDPAKGFKVHTPSGTVTDLGTEFGVYVDARAEQQVSREEEQQPGGGPQFHGTQPPVTEVHVFKGQVDVAPGDQLAQAAGQENPPPKSEIRNQKSKIISAGQAVTISEKKIEPLPAADPFKFALDRLNGKPRTVLLAEDFEAYELGRKDNALGPWTIQSGIRKGQGVSIDNFDKLFTDHVAQHELEDKSLLPLPPSISQVVTFIPSHPNPPQTFPRLARAIDAPQLTHTCQVLLEFVMIPVHTNPEPSLALATEAGSAPGIEFWRNADPAAPRAAWDVRRCYRLRILLDVVEGTLRDARVERSAWRGNEGWVRDADYRTPVPKVDWTTPPKFVIFGYPMVSPQTPPGVLSIDNIRMEVIAEK